MRVADLAKMVLTYILIVLTLASCKKYEEGPAISFRSTSKRLQGKYVVAKMVRNGIDVSDIYRDSCNCNVFFPEQEYYVELLDCKSENEGALIPGLYGFQDKEDFFIVFFEKMPEEDTVYGFGPFNYGVGCSWTIVRLTNKEIILESECINAKYRIEMHE